MFVKRKVRLIMAVSQLLTLCLVVALFSPVAGAAKADKVYYSDLFYGYSHEYLNSAYLRSYAMATSQTMIDIHDTYLDSGGSFWTGYRESLKGVTDPRVFFSCLTDALGLTNIAYENALDSANKEFLLKQMDGLAVNGTQNLESTGRIATELTKLDDLMSGLEEFTLVGEGKAASVEKILNFFKEMKFFKSISDSQLMDLAPLLIEDAGKVFSCTEDVIDFAKVLYMGLLLEDVRLSMLDSIVENATPNSALEEGMNRLRSQVRGGFAQYFFDNYIMDKVYDQIFGLVKNVATGVVSPAGAAMALISIADTVVFEWLADVPDLDDLLKQMILREYATGLYSCVINKSTVFIDTFEPSEVFAYEDLVNALIAATNAGLEATKDLTLDSNKSDLEDIVAQYGAMSYDSYKADLLESVEAIDRDDRMVKTYSGQWVIPEGGVFDTASDSLRNNCIYMFEGAVRADCFGTKSFLLGTLSGNTLVIEGELKVKGGYAVALDSAFTAVEKLNIYDGGTVKNEGVLNCGELLISPAYNGHSYLYNYGALNILGDVTLEYSEPSVYAGSYGCLMQNEENAHISIGGDVYAENMECFHITNGLVWLSGDTRQKVTNLAAHNLIFDNPVGIEYMTDIHVTGEFAPAYSVLDDSAVMIGNGHYIRLQPGATLSNRTGTHGNIRLAGGTLTVGSTVDDLYVDQAYTLSCGKVMAANVTVNSALTVAEDAELAINGELKVREGKTVTNNGIIRCKDLTEEAGSLYDTDFYNHGQLFVSGDMNLAYDSSYPADYGYLHQADENAVVYVGGDILAGNTGCFDITAGMFELCGSQLQELTNLSACNLTISNPAGVRYLTGISLSGRFSNEGNPIDCNGYRAILTNNASLADSLVSYGNFFVTGNVSLGSCIVDELLVRGKVTVAEGKSAVVRGDLEIYLDGQFVNEGSVRCKNLLLLATTSNSNSTFYNNGCLSVEDDLTLERSGSYPVHTGRLYQTETDAELFLGDDVFADSTLCWEVTGGAVRSVRVDRTIALIDAIGTVTVDRLSAVAAAREAYNALGYVLQKYVTNYGLLIAAETALTPIREAVEAMTFTAEAKGQQVTAAVTSGKGELPALTVLLCSYDAQQRFVSCAILCVDTVAEGQTVYLYGEVPEEAQWKAFLVTPSALLPLAECHSDNS